MLTCFRVSPCHYTLLSRLGIDPASNLPLTIELSAGSRSPFSDSYTRLPWCPEMARLFATPAVRWKGEPGQPQTLPGADVARPAVRRGLLRRRHLDGYLLPAGLPRQDS